MNLEKRCDICSCIISTVDRFKSSCSIAFLRVVEPQESPEYNAIGLFCALKRLFLLLSQLSGG